MKSGQSICQAVASPNMAIQACTIISLFFSLSPCSTLHSSAPGKKHSRQGTTKRPPSSCEARRLVRGVRGSAWMSCTCQCPVADPLSNDLPRRGASLCPASCRPRPIRLNRNQPVSSPTLEPFPLCPLVVPFAMLYLTPRHAVGDSVDRGGSRSVHFWHEER